MTIFHVIKYPVSDIPKAEERDRILSGVPEVYSAWMELCKDENRARQALNMIHGDRLRKILLEYEGPL